MEKRSQEGIIEGRDGRNMGVIGVSLFMGLDRIFLLSNYLWK